MPTSWSTESAAKTREEERAQERVALKAAYEARASIRTRATAGGHSCGYVHDALTETGTQLRGRGGPNNRKPVPIPPDKTSRRGPAQQVSEQ
ncbi:helix-turn-helix domain-containing protein [Mycobacteroides chelonae]|uniref:helix-turn-helix domain-containing protein n=1 Tax=Mycobacteroides chelonae TaxID=1774 RepID=UPI000993F91D|nr:helix-turn-helix domain-containing protein [Mycobacteroides chelonae]MBF9327891.1 transcriptional regulator [Mycobacteroides chelonae]MBF9422069.1 transcriptional regulator [Mycobacteroides chelonae]MBF9435742.1 transcriptional regulator [Mycobacteroides chelonae]MBV6361981.1 transcriptional regulator [Mycobacteroides chelonae]MEC4837326.1 helix-turn-helix domain-containing protein [Mycobacteroides chelonae]